MDFDSLQKLYEIDEDFLFEHGLLIFDTSSLIELYYYSEDVACDILDKSYDFFGSSRMFLPSHVKFEFDKNRINTIQKSINIYDSLLDPEVKDAQYPKMVREIDDFLTTLNKLNEKLTGNLQTFEESLGGKQKHPYLSTELIRSLCTAKEDFFVSLPRENPFVVLGDSIQKEINERKQELQSKFAYDSIQNKINNYFSIGRDYSYAELLEISQQGEWRYNSKIPPGYMDVNGKVGFQIYGDLIIWKQLLEYAKERNLPCIFVSDDTKEDWNEFHENTEGKKSKKTNPRKARVELLFEFYEEVNQRFRKLTLRDFIFELNDKSGDKFEVTTLKEIEIKHLSELIDEEVIDFINSIQAEILKRVKDDIVAPEEAYDYDLENEDIYISYFSVSLPENPDEMTVTYDVEVTVICEMTYWEYWGRDDDTGQAFLSPSGSASWSGTKEYRIRRDIEVDSSENIRTTSYDIELVEDDVHYRKESWGDIEDKGIYW